MTWRSQGENASPHSKNSSYAARAALIRENCLIGFGASSDPPFLPTNPLFVQSELSPSTRDFIIRHIVSVEELEILLLLHEGKDRDWSPAEINARLRSQESSIAQWLRTLVSMSLAAETGGRYRFAPASEELARDTAAVSEAYRERRIKVIELIFSRPSESLLSFVRAFELRKRP